MTAELVKMEPKKKPQPKVRLEPLEPHNIVETWRLMEKSLKEAHPAYPDFDETPPEDMRAQLFAQMASPGFMGLVAKQGRKPVGHILALAFSRNVGRPGKYIQVLDVYVEPEFRAKGVGKELITKLMGTAKTAGFHYWEGNVSPAMAKEMKNAATLYVRVGGKTT